jgi:hypothetical protein
MRSSSRSRPNEGEFRSAASADADAASLVARFHCWLGADIAAWLADSDGRRISTGIAEFDNDSRFQMETGQAGSFPYRLQGWRRDLRSKDVRYRLL